jgi:hypothetical protein
MLSLNGANGIIQTATAFDKAAKISLDNGFNGIRRWSGAVAIIGVA